MISIGLIGFGHWGPKLLNNFWNNKNFSFIAVAEQSPARQKIITENYPNIKIYDDAKNLIKDEKIQAVIIACKAKDHYPLAKETLLKGKHVLIEKPLCTSSLEVMDLIQIADQKNLTLMVDHILIFDSVVQKIKLLQNQKYFGNITYYDATRANLGLFQPDVSVLWDLAPHDLAVMDYIFDEEPIAIEANGFCHINENLNDVANLTLHFASKKTAMFKFSWVWPFKQRITLIRGDKNTAFWDDNGATEYPLSLYNSGLQFDKKNNAQTAQIPTYNTGDLLRPKIEKLPALIGVANHFAEVIKGQTRSLMDGKKGLRIVKILETAEKQIVTKIATLKYTR